MRALTIGVLSGLCACAGVKKYLPEGPVLSEQQRAAWTEAPSGVSYTSEPVVPFPVIPLQVWGVSYDVDLVLESEHDRYDMHEYARVQTPDGPVWLAKDALSATKSQSIVADLEDLESWVPEMPVERKVYPVEVDDRSTEDWLDLDIRYENLDGEPVAVHYEGAAPHSLQKKRNGNTMGHSANVAMAVLNIPYRDFGKRASVNIAGEDYKIRKLLGLVKLQVVLVQTQGGLSVSEFRQTGTDELFTSVMGPGDRDIGMSWYQSDSEDGLVVQQPGGFRELFYTFDKVDGALELSKMQVKQFGFEDPIVTISLSPALPDLRRKFEGEHTSRFVVDVDDQLGHAVGRLVAFWEGDQVKVKLLPDEPEWVTDRPMLTTITYGQEEREIPSDEAAAPAEEEAAAEDPGEPMPPHPEIEIVYTADVSIVRVPVESD